jgi:hypothetical protein
MKVSFYHFLKNQKPELLFLVEEFLQLSILVFWPHSVFGQNHLCVNML